MTMRSMVIRTFLPSRSVWDRYQIDFRSCRTIALAIVLISCIGGCSEVVKSSPKAVGPPHEPTADWQEEFRKSNTDWQKQYEQAVDQLVEKSTGTHVAPAKHIGGIPQDPPAILLSDEDAVPGTIGKLASGWKLAGTIKPSTKFQGTKIAISPTGEFVAGIGYRNDTILLWDVKTGANRVPLIANRNNTIRSLAFSYDGKLVAAGGWERADGRSQDKAYIFHVDSRKEVTRFPADRVDQVTFSQDGKLLATAGRTVRLWDTESWKQMSVIRFGDPNRTHIVDCEFFPDGKRLAIALMEAVVIWDLKQNKELYRVSRKSSVGPIAISPDGKTVAATCGYFDRQGAGSAILIDAGTGQIEQRLADRPGEIRSIEFLSNGYLVTGSRGRPTEFWDIKNRRHLGSLPEAASNASSVVISKDLIATLVDEKPIHFWTTESKVVANVAEPKTLDPVMNVESKSGLVTFVPGRDLLVYSPKFANKGTDKRIQVFDLNRKTEKTSVALQFTPDKLTVSSDGSYLVARRSARLQICDLRSFKAKPVFEFPRGGRLNSRVSTSVGTRVFVTVLKDNTIVLADLKSGRTKELQWPDEIDGVAIGHEDRILAIRDKSESVTIIDIATETKITQAPYYDGEMVFSRDGKRLAFVANRTCVWNIDRANTEFVADGVFTRSAVAGDATRVAAVQRNDDKESNKTLARFISVFDTETGIKTHQADESCSDLALSENGRWLASSGNGALKVWDLNESEEVETPLAESPTSTKTPVAQKTPSVSPLKGIREENVESIQFSADGHLNVISKLGRGSKLYEFHSWIIDARRVIHEGGFPASNSPTIVAFVPDGSLFVVGYSYGTVRLFDNGGRLRGEKLLHPRSVIALAISADGKTLVSSCYHGNLYVWDLPKLERRKTLQLKGVRATSLAVTRDGKRLVSAHKKTKDNYDALASWDLEAGRKLYTFLQGTSDRNPELGSVAISDDLSIVACWVDDHVQVWDGNTGQSRCNLRTRDDHYSFSLEKHGTAVTPDGKWLVRLESLKNSNSRIVLYDTHTWQPVRFLVDVSLPVEAVCISHDGGLVSCRGKEGIQVWNLSVEHRGKDVQDIGADVIGPLHSFANGRKPVLKVTFSPSNGFVAGATTNHASIWNLKNGTPIDFPTLGGAIDFSSDDDGMIVVATPNLYGPTGSILEWSGPEMSSDRLGSRRPNSNFRWLPFTASPKDLHEAKINAIECSADGSWIVSRSLDNQVKLWNAASHSLRITLANPALCFAIHPPTKSLITGNPNGRLDIWSMSGKLKRKGYGPKGKVYVVRSSGNGKQMASWGTDGLYVWEWKNTPLKIDRPVVPVRDLAFSPDGRLLAVADESNHVFLFDVATRKLTHRFEGHEASVNSLSFSSDGKLLASGSDDMTVKIWKLP